VPLFGRQAPTPSDVPAQLRRALQLVLSADLEGAEEALSEAGRLDSSSADIYLALANLYRARGEIGRAIQLHQNLLLRPDLDEAMRREALLGLALDFRAGGFLQRALSSFEELLEVKPHHTRALREIEKIRVETGDWEEAILIRKRIGSDAPNTGSVLAHLHVGLARSKRGDNDPAAVRRLLKKALSHDRRCAEAHIELGDERLAQGKPHQAIALWLRALPLHEGVRNLLLPKLFDAYDATQNREGFDRLLYERLEANPDDHEAGIWLARSLTRQGQTEEAQLRLRRLLDRSGGYLPAYVELARAYLAEPSQREAVKLLEEMLNHLPSSQPKFRCSNCGTQDSELHWRCPQCGEWDSSRA